MADIVYEGPDGRAFLRYPSTATSVPRELTSETRNPIKSATNARSRGKFPVAKDVVKNVNRTHQTERLLKICMRLETTTFRPRSASILLYSGEAARQNVHKMSGLLSY